MEVKNNAWFIWVGFLVLLNVTSLASADEDQELPDKIISGYNGWFAPNAENAKNQLESIIEQSLDPLAKNGFTAYHIKIQGANKENVDLSKSVQKKRVRQLAEAAAGRDLELLTYVYDSVNHGKRNPGEHSEYPPVVRKDGTVVEDQFSLIHYPTWKFLFTEAFELARASRELPIASVQIDVERVQPGLISYDDRAWRRFAGEHELAPDTPREDREEKLEKRNLSETYEKWFRNQMNRVAERFEEELHRINPDLSLGIMPTKRSWVIWPFVRHLGTERAPAVIDHWGMYNGTGLTDSVLGAQEAVKNANPNNRFVPWFRPDSYRPEDIRVQAYHALRKTDGYSMWHLGMLSNSSRNGRSLPGSHTGDDYFQAFGEANLQAMEDLAKEGKPVSIPFEKPESIAAELPDEVIDRVQVPQLEPIGGGTGEPAWIPTRELQVFYVYARAGDELRMDVRHLAGQARPRSLQYALVDKRHKRLRQEAVAPGKTQSFSVNAPHDGTYALVITGGSGGQAWYGVRIHNDHVAMPAGNDSQERVRLFMTRAIGGKTVDLYLTRTNPKGEASVHVGTGRGQIIAAQLNDEPPVRIEQRERSLSLPEGRAVHHLRISPPDEVPDGVYVQGVRIRVSGAVSSYLSDHPSRRLLPGSDEN